MNALLKLMLVSAVFLAVTSSVNADGYALGISKKQEKEAYEKGKKAAEDRKSGANSSGKMTDKEKEDYKDAQFQGTGTHEAYKRGYREGQ